MTAKGAVKLISHDADRIVQVLHEKDGFVIDVARISIFDLEDLREAERNMQYRAMAKIIMGAVVQLPEGWGDPRDLESYRKPVHDWNALVGAYTEAATSQKK